jgi:hypothetical protein
MSVKVFESMLGLTMKSVVGKAGDDEMIFTADNGKRFTFYHGQDCCEYVRIEDVCGDLSDLVGSPLTMAKEVDSIHGLGNGEDSDYSNTWTFYHFGTANGSVVVRWLGSSNGYYSESVDVREDDAPASIEEPVVASVEVPVGPVSMPISRFGCSMGIGLS